MVWIRYLVNVSWLYFLLFRICYPRGYFSIIYIFPGDTNCRSSVSWLKQICHGYICGSSESFWHRISLCSNWKIRLLGIVNLNLEYIKDIWMLFKKILFLLTTPTLSTISTDLLSKTSILYNWLCANKMLINFENLTISYLKSENLIFFYWYPYK